MVQETGVVSQGDAMIKGSQFRGINYKCAMLNITNEQWDRAIKELVQIMDPTDPQIYEILAKCYLKLGQADKHLEHMNLAITSYEALGDPDKAARLREALPK
jgi:hypothetical protein